MNGFLKLIYKIKDEIIYEECQNLVVNQAGIITSNWLSANGNSSALSQIVIGDDPVNTTDKTTTSLGGYSFPKNIDSISATGNVVTINFSIATTEFNGYDIWQFGLMTDENQLFSIMSRKKIVIPPPTISKTSDIDIVGIWTITVEV